jgi:hypothetical protein
MPSIWLDTDLEQRSIGATQAFKEVETILNRLHESIINAKPSQDHIYQFAKIFGSYIGEVIRRNHGARWGMVSIGSDRLPGMQTERKKAEFWPWGKVQNRITNGAEDNVWHYFQTITTEDGQE